jgi:DNA-directed RNA polymerase subunit N (RpoN/RPB10)
MSKKNKKKKDEGGQRARRELGLERYCTCRRAVSKTDHVKCLSVLQSHVKMTDCRHSSAMITCDNRKRSLTTTDACYKRR